MSSRTLTLTLTEPQFFALANAVALADVDLAAEETSDADRQRRTLDRAWLRLHAAWHGKARR